MTPPNLYWRSLVRAAQLPVTAFLSTLVVHLLHIEESDWGARLLPTFAESDTYYYLHKAWFSAFVDPSGGELSAVIPLSPYVSLMTWAYRILGPYPIVPFLLNAILTALTAAFVATTARRLFGEMTGWLAGLTIAFCGPILFFAGLAVKTNLELPVLAMAMYFAVRYFSKPGWIWLALASAATTLLALERNNMAVLIPWLAGLAVVPHLRPLAPRALAVTVLGVMLPVAAVAALASWEPQRVEQRFFSPVGLNFYVGNAPESTGGYTYVKGIRNDLVGHHTDAVRVAEQERGRSLTRAQVSGYWFGKSLRYIAEQPFDYMILQARKFSLLLAYAAYGSPEEYRVWRWEHPSLALAVLDYGAVLSLFLLGVFALRGRLRDPPVLFLLGGIALYAFTLWIFFVHERYRLPLIVMMTPLAAYGIARILRAPDRTRRVRYLAFVGVVYGASILLAFTIPVQPGWSSDLAAARAQESRRLQAQMPSYRWKKEVVLSATPRAWTELSKDLFARRFPRDALAVAERAIALAPHDNQTYWNLFTLLARQKDRGGLERLRARIERAPAGHADDRRKLGDLQREIGRRLSGADYQ